MDRSYYTDDFEELIRDKADQYKMYPSDKVWKGINRSLHKSRRWYWLSFILFLAGISYFAIRELSSPVQSKPVTDNGSNPSVNDHAAQEDAPILPITALPISNKENILAANTAIAMEEAGRIVEMYPSNVGNNATIVASEYEIAAPAITVTAAYKAKLPGADDAPRVLINHFLVPEIVLDKPTEDEAGTYQHKEQETRVNWLQEKAVYELSTPRISRIAWQLSFSPTMNYRKLMGNNNANINSDAKNIPLARNIQGDIDHLVNHKPAVGFELGSFVLYKLNRNITLKTGLQFNYSQYDIQAYDNYSSEVATIALTATTPYSNPGNITSITRLRNFGGDEPKALRNQYFQLSAPVGAELLLLNGRRLQLAVAGTIQPTYLMNRNTYLITTDYKNYTREPSLVRRWNLNTSAEAFVAYQAAGLRWQIGPQFRYQLLSSYSQQYPVREYLMEYGLKLGISKTIR